MRFFEAIYNNIHHIPLFICYVFNAISVSADTSFTLVWLGINSHFALTMSMLMIAGWFLLFLSSHNDARQEAPQGQKLSKEDLRTFIQHAIDIGYIHQSAPNQRQEDFDPTFFNYLFSLSVFHYFKKAFADRVYQVMQKKTPTDSEKDAVETCKQVKKELDELEPTSLLSKDAIQYLGFEYQDTDDKFLRQQIKNCNKLIHDYIACLKRKLGDTQSKIENTINFLDTFSINMRNEIVDAINNEDKRNAFFVEHFPKTQAETITESEQKLTLKLLLKTEHTYTLASQRSLLPFINAFSKINAFSNGLILLASGYLKVGINPLYLAAFACSGMACSYILTGPKILSIMRNISGYWENYTRSSREATKRQHTSFVFKLSIITAAITACASGLFAYYVLSTFLHLFTHPAILITGYCVAALLTCIAFCGAFCLYFDSIFSILSSNKKDIYSPEDNFFSLFANNPISLATLKGFTILACLTGLLYLVSLQQNMALLISTVVLVALSTCLISEAREQSITFTALAIGLCIAACNIHQICIIFAITLNPISLPCLLLFASVQASTMTCTFYKGLSKCTKIFEKIGGMQRPTHIADPKNNPANPIALSPQRRRRSSDDLDGNRTTNPIKRSASIPDLRTWPENPHESHGLSLDNTGPK